VNNCWKKIVLDQLRGYVYNSENQQEEIRKMGFLRKTLLKSVVVILLVIFSSNPCLTRGGEPDRDLGK
jgi:hypothetical protein